MNKYRTAFLGTPDFAVPILRTLIEDTRCLVDFVVTQPDRPAGRGHKLVAPPVKHLAEEFNIRVFQPASLKSIEIDREASALSGKVVLKGRANTDDLVSYLNSIEPLDIMITAAYGNIIPASLLNLGKVPMVNVHPSLLPRWRGAAPLQWSIFQGDKQSGVCLMKVEEGLDTGPVFAEVKTEISADDSLGSLHDRLAHLGSELLYNKLESIIQGELSPRLQDEAHATYAHKWEKEDALIKWHEPAIVSERRIRASNPIPGARTYNEGQMIKVFVSAVIESSNYPLAAPGTVVGVESDRLVVACGEESFLALLELQLPGHKRLKTSEVLKGFVIERGTLLSDN